MGIAIGKLSLYTACGGISPAYTLPVALDVGTNNPQALDDPMYMGRRSPRISAAEYNAFVDGFIDALQARWPGVLVQFEDFAQPMPCPSCSGTGSGCAALMMIFREQPRLPWVLFWPPAGKRVSSCAISGSFWWEPDPLAGYR